MNISIYFNKIKNLLKNNVITTLLFFLLLVILNGYFFNYLNSQFFKLNNNAFDSFTKQELFVVAVIIAPIIETLLFQFLLYNFLIFMKLKNVWQIIFIMSFIFSQVHWYNWLYVVATFFCALFFNLYYIFIVRSKNKFLAILMVTILHSLYNLFGFLFVE